MVPCIAGVNSKLLASGDKCERQSDTLSSTMMWGLGDGKKRGGKRLYKALDVLSAILGKKAKALHVYPLKSTLS